VASRIDQCWIGKANPLSVTQAATTVAIGLDMDASGWLTCTDEMCVRLADVLNAAYAATWSVARDSATGKINIGSDANFDVVIEPGWAEWAGFTSSPYLATQSITSETTPPHFTDDVRIGLTLPIRYWRREVNGNQRPTVWSSHWAWDLSMVTDAETILRTMQTPFAIHSGNNNTWEMGNRDGYVTLRPLWDQLTRSNVANNIGTWGLFQLRGEWLNPSVGA